MDQRRRLEPEKTRVAVIGSPWVGGTSRSAADGFADAGFRTFLVPFLDWRPDWLYTELFPGTGAVTRVATAAMLPALELRLLQALRRIEPDLVFFLKCDDVHDFVYDSIRASIGARIAAFHPDDPFATATLTRRGPSHRRAVLQMRTVDSYFVWSHRLVDKARASGAKNAHYLPFGYDPRLYPAIEPTDDELAKLGEQVTFLGNWGPDRERWLGPLTEFNLGIYGSPYWKTRCKDERVTAAWRPAPSMGREEKCRLVRASAINLNFLRAQNADACNQRTFELPGCGAFMLHERSAALPEMFTPGVHCDDFASPEELRDKIRFYLAHPDVRRRIARAGQERAQEFSYRRWAERIAEAALA